MIEAEGLLWWYRARCWRIVDGDTLDVVVDLGFRARIDQRLRLLGVDTPELRGGTPKEREAAVQARGFVAEWLKAKQMVRSASPDRYGRIHLLFDPERFPLLIRTHKSDSFGRFLAVVRAGGESITLSEALIAAGLGSKA